MSNYEDLKAQAKQTIILNDKGLPLVMEAYPLVYLDELGIGATHTPHPAFKIAKDAQDMVTRQMKALNLTVEDLSGEADEDPLTDLTKKLTKKRKAPTIIKPVDDPSDNS